PVRVPVIGMPDKGYKVTGISVIPSMVEIKGAKSEISEINLLKTETIDVTSLDKDFQQNVKINTGGKNIMINTPEVLVKITISGVQR
ncbi:MAG TPA: YbbR-like domain-containing protein, partial [Nitrospirae bacterium]|nr:YbbR-like domain-containing protein [Nitrospirota bacterium]